MKREGVGGGVATQVDRGPCPVVAGQKQVSKIESWTGKEYQNLQNVEIV